MVEKKLAINKKYTII